MSVLRRLRIIVWGEAPTDPKEAKLLLKMDWFILSFACLLYWINYLERIAFINAWTLSLQEDLGLRPEQFSQANTVFTVGYTVALVPHNIILLKVRPSIWLSFCCFAWGLLVLGLYKVEHFYQICVIRFFQAVFEASTFTGVHLILSRWYKESELTKRSAIFTCSGLLGNIFSGTLQAAIYTNMDGINGLAGWRWLYIINFIISIPIFTYGFFFFPDTPDTCKVFYLSKEEVELAQKRMERPQKDKLDWSVIKRVTGKWHWWFFSFLWVLGGENESYATNGLFALYLQYFDYDIVDRNHYPMGVYGVGIFFTFIFALYVDGTGARYHYRVACAIAVIMIISTILLLADPLNHHVAFAGHYLSGCAYAGQATFFAWANVVCADDLQERAIVLASMNMFSNAVNAWWSILFYNADTAPKFRRGCYAMIATAIVSVIVACAIRYLQLREEKHQEIDQSPDSVDDEKTIDSTTKTPQVNTETIPVDSNSNSH